MTSRDHSGGRHGEPYTEVRATEETFRPQFEFFERVFAGWSTPAKKLLELWLDQAHVSNLLMLFKVWKKVPMSGGSNFRHGACIIL